MAGTLLSRRAALLATVFTFAAPQGAYATDTVVANGQTRTVTGSGNTSGGGNAVGLGGQDTLTVEQGGTITGAPTSSEGALVLVNSATSGAGVTITNSGNMINTLATGGSVIKLVNTDGIPSNFTIVNTETGVMRSARGPIMIGSGTAAPISGVPRDANSTIVIDNAGLIQSTLNTQDGAINTYLTNSSGTSGPSVTFFNRATGIVQGARDAIKAGTITIDNAGQILAATGGDAIDVRGNDASGTIINRAGGVIRGDRAIIGGGGGSIGAGDTVFSATVTGTAYQSSVTHLTITNEAGGLIEGAAGNAISGAMGVTVDNAGEIRASGASGSGINVSGTASVNAVTASDITIRSTGTIAGASASTTAINLDSAADPDDVVTIEAGATIVGRINMGGGNDVLNLGGTGTATMAVIQGVESLNVLSGDWTFADDPFDAGARGDIAIAGGATLRIGAGATAGGFAGGNIADDGLLVYNRADDFSQAAGDAITGAGAFEIDGTGRYILSGANAYTGDTRVNGGSLVAGAANSFSGASAVIVAAGAHVDLAGFDQSIGSLAGGGDVDLGAGTLTLTGSGAADFSGAITGSGGLVLAGGGTQTLSGTSDYSGPTAVDAGRLNLDGAIASDVSVAGGAALAGTGTTSGAVTIADGGHLAPGEGGIGTLTAGSLILNAGSILDFDFGAPNAAAGVGSDLVTVQGDLTLDGTLNVTNVGGLGAGVYRIIGYGGSLTDHGLDLGALPGGIDPADITVQTSEAGWVNIIFTGSGGSGPPPALQFWDGGDPALADNGQVDGGSGVWRADSTPNWALGDGTGNNGWGGGMAVFQGTAGTVTVEGSVDASAMQFLTDGYVIAAGTDGAINLTDAASNLRVDGAGTVATIEAPLTGTGGVLKQGDGILVLAGANDYAGATHIAGGVLRVEGGQAITDTSIVTIDTGATLDLGADETIGGLSGSGGVTLGASTLTVATNGASSFSGTISGAGGLTKTGTGTLTLAGIGAYTGTTTVSGGRLTAGADDAIGAGALVIAQGATVDLAGHANDFASLTGGGTLALGAGNATIGGDGSSTTFSGTITGAGTLTKVGAGTLTLAGANSYGGGTNVIGGVLAAGVAGAIGGGPLAIGSGATVNLGGFATTLGSLSGAGTLALGGSALTVGGDNGSTSFAGTITGAGSLTKIGTGTLTLAGANGYTGPTAVNGGTLAAGANGALGGGALTIGTAGTVDLGGFSASVGSLAGAGRVALAGGTLTAGSDNSSTSFSGTISGNGGLTKTGTGTLTLTGANSFTGTTTVGAGTLVNNGSLASNLVLLAGARFQGSGSVAGATFGGTVAPGNSIGTIAVNGNATFAAGSTYEVEVDQAGAHDLVAATGTVTIQGGTVSVLAAAETPAALYPTAGSYQIVTAAGGLSGTFGTVTSNLAFLTPSLSYTSSAVVLTLMRNDVTFAQVAETPNQRGVARAIDSARGATPLYPALLGLSADGARAAFTSLAGEFYASAPTALFREAGEARAAILDHVAESDGLEGTRIWVKYLDSSSHQSGTANGRLARDTSGIFGGIDRDFGPVRIGLGGGWTSSDLAAPSLGSSADAQTAYVAVYAGGVWGRAHARVGASYAWHDLDARRSIAFGNFSDSTRADLNGSTFQVFGELGYSLPLGPLTAEPYVGVGWERTRLGRGTETGGAAALSLLDTDSLNVPFGVAGLRLDATLRRNFHLHGAVADRVQYDPVSERNFTLAGIAQAFNVTGLGFETNNVTFDAGASVDILSGSIGLTYSGERAGRYDSNAIRVTASWRF